MPDLAGRITLLRAALHARPVADPDLADAITCARAAVDPAYAAELDREHRYARTGGLSGARRGGVGKLADDELPRCEWCRARIVNPLGACPSCGHRPDLAAGGHRRFKHR